MNDTVFHDGFMCPVCGHTSCTRDTVFDDGHSECTCWNCGVRFTTEDEDASRQQQAAREARQ